MKRIYLALIFFLSVISDGSFAQEPTIKSDSQKQASPPKATPAKQNQTVKKPSTSTQANPETQPNKATQANPTIQTSPSTQTNPGTQANPPQQKSPASSDKQIKTTTPAAHSQSIIESHGYIRFLKDFQFEMNNSTIIINPNEIFEYKKSNNEAFLIYEGNEVRLKNKHYARYDFSEDISELKSKLVTKIGIDSFRIDITPLHKDASEKVYIYRFDGTTIDFLKDDLVKTFTIDTNILSQTFRLAYSKMPSFVYSKNDFPLLTEIPKTPEANAIIDTVDDVNTLLINKGIDKKIDNPDSTILELARNELKIINISPEKLRLIKEKYGFEEPFPWLWVVFLCGFIALVTILIVFRKRISSLFNKSDKQAELINSKDFVNQNVQTAYFSGGSLTDFCQRNNLTLDDLVKLNKEKIPSHFKRMENDEQRIVKRRLKKQRLVIRILEGTEYVETTPTINDQNYTSLSNRLNSVQIDFNSRIRKLENDFRDFEDSNQILKRDKESLKTKLSISESDNLKNVSLLRDYTTNIIYCEDLVKTAAGISDLIRVLKEPIDNALEISQRIYKSNDDIDIQIIAEILLKFNQQNHKPDKWIQICEQVKFSKKINDELLVNRLSQLNNSDQLEKSFVRLIFVELLDRYISDVLILCEEMRNFSKFTNSSGLENSFSVSFADSINKILSSAKSKLNLEIYHVALFTKYSEYSPSTIQVISEPLSKLYTYLKEPFAADQIIEIKSFGYGGFENLMQKQPAKVIIKK